MLGKCHKDEPQVVEHGTSRVLSTAFGYQSHTMVCPTQKECAVLVGVSVQGVKGGGLLSPAM